MKSPIAPAAGGDRGRRVPRILAVVAAALVGLLLVSAGALWLLNARSLPGGADGPTGLAARFTTPPPWTPSALDQPLRAASAVLDSPLRPTSPGPGLDGHTLARGPVLLSADGTQYRSLPAGESISAVVLSPDGRQVAWGVAGSGTGAEVGVRLLRLDSGRAVAARLTGDGGAVGAAGGQVQQLVWERSGSLLAVGALHPSPGAAAQPGVWRVAPDGAVTRLCGCADVTLAIDASGRLFQAGPGTALVPGARRVVDGDRLGRDGTAVAGLGGAQLVVSPDGARWAEVAATGGLGGSNWQLALHGPAPGQLTRLAVPAPARRTWTALAWTPAGLYLADQGRPAGLWLVDPATGRGSRVSTGDAGEQLRPHLPASVVGVATELAARAPGTQPAVAGQPPSFPFWQWERLRDLAAGRGVGAAGAVGTVLGLLLLDLLAVLAWRHRRRLTALWTRLTTDPEPALPRGNRAERRHPRR